MIKHVWFDMGGTLYQETSAFDELHDALRYEAYAKIVDEPDLGKAKQSYDKLYAQYGSNSAVFSSLGKPSDFWQNTFDGMDLASVIVPDPAIRQTLEQISATMPVSLFTNFKLQKIESVLELLDIPRNMFTHILSGDDVQKRKPDPEGFMKMVELSNLPADRLLYIGDRVDVDIKPANAIGMQTCLLWQSSAEADFYAEQFANLPQIIQGSK